MEGVLTIGLRGLILNEREARMLKKLKKPKAAKTLPATSFTRAGNSTPARLLFEQQICNQFEAMEESRNDRIIKALSDHLKSKAAAQSR